jgi:hypothetical protein
MTQAEAEARVAATIDSLLTSVRLQLKAVLANGPRFGAK